MARTAAPTATQPGVPMADENGPKEPQGDALHVKTSEFQVAMTPQDDSTYDWDPDSVVMARQSRSQSLTDPRTMASSILRQQSSIASPVASVAVEGDATRSVAFLLVEEHALEVAHRRMRRTKSAELSSMSMLQQELGYPRPRKASISGNGADSATNRGRRASRRSRNSHSASEDVGSSKTSRRPKSTSDAPTLGTSDEEGSVVEGHAAEGEEDEEEEEEENFLDHRLASVTGYARDTDGVVYYEIVVESTAHGPLSAYKVRRRYSEFRELHRKLAKIMPTRAPSSSRLSVGGLSGLGALTASGYTRHTESSLDTASERAMSQSLHHPERSASELTRSLIASAGCWLPPLPDSGGVWSYFQGDSPRFLENRARSFHAIVIAAQQHPAARASRLLNQFLGPPPDSLTNNYVSLNRFAAPTLRFSVEIHERKEVAKSISLKRRQLEPSYKTAAVPPSIAE